MPVYFRRFNAKISKMMGVAAIFSGLMLLGDGHFLAFPFFFVGGLILVTRNAANNGGIRGTSMDILGFVIALIGVGIVTG